MRISLLISLILGLLITAMINRLMAI